MTLCFQVEDAMLGQQIEQYNEAINRLHYQRHHVSDSAVQAAAVAMEADVAQALLDISSNSTTASAVTTSGFH